MKFDYIWYIPSCGETAVLIGIPFMWVWYQIVADLDLKQFVLLFKTWSEHASGQIASTIQLYHSRKCLIGDFSSVEIFFWFLSLTALSVQLLFNDQERRRNASYFWSRCWIFIALVQVSNSFCFSFSHFCLGGKWDFKVLRNFGYHLMFNFLIVHCWYNIQSNSLGILLQGYSTHHTWFLLFPLVLVLVLISISHLISFFLFPSQGWLLLICGFKTADSQ